ncbi:MAG: PH domain-containing protein [Alphaproteobacteria bacterium]|jgi:hypothetical protein|nr:photosynthetic complex putative assembly protein PuhB [Beijerinckiaceae bacterium]NBQ39440.1 PH domain-containing protein [Alphaproteobacteria bacterium]
MSHDDFDFDPVRGLPEVLPAGERMLWQGSPRWQDMALHAFHVRKVAVYFAVITLAVVVLRLADDSSLLEALKPVLWYLPLTLVAVGLLSGLAWASAKTTIYTITTKRIVLRIGIALPMSLNVPFSLIENAGLRTYASGAGDIPVELKGDDRVAWLILWPHARPFHLKNPQPMLRAVPQAATIARLLADALQGKATVSIPSERKVVRFASNILTA